MPDTKFSADTLGSALTGAELFGMSQGGADRSLTARMIAAYIGEGLGNQSTADQSPGAGATSYLTGSDILVPDAERIRVGTIFRWHGIMTKTAAGTAASSLLVKAGVNGTTADATIATFTLPAGTAAVDTGYFEINGIVRAIGASATMQLSCLFTHNLATTGLITANQAILQALSSAFASTTNLLKFGLAFTAGSSQAWTYKQIFAAAKNL